MARPEGQGVRELNGAAVHWPAAIADATEPLLIRGAVSDWALVAAAGTGGALDYLRSLARAVPVPVMRAPAAAGGRLGYNEDLSGFSFRRERQPLDALLDALGHQRDQADAETLYLGSASIETFFPGLDARTPLAAGAQGGIKSIWIGNRTLVPAHQDLPDNLTCVGAGRRRFTLFPPDQLDNLYVGPLDFTPAGQAISLTDSRDPDLERFPRYAQALAQARSATLAPGDVLFIPSMWWHQVEALDGFNVMVNYWWRRAPAYMDTPMNALMLAILSIRDLPAHERAVWESVFRHYVFAAEPDRFEHVPAAARGVLGPMDADRAARLRARLLSRINR